MMHMPKCRVIVEFQLQEDAIQKFKEILVQSTANTLNEKGCLSAGMYQDLESTTHFRCIEDWESYEDLMAHLHSDKIKSPEDAYYYIQENLIGEESIHFFSEFYAQTK